MAATKPAVLDALHDLVLLSPAARVDYEMFRAFGLAPVLDFALQFDFTDVAPGQRDRRIPGGFPGRAGAVTPLRVGRTALVAVVARAVIDRVGGDAAVYFE